MTDKRPSASQRRSDYERLKDWKGYGCKSPESLVQCQCFQHTIFGLVAEITNLRQQLDSRIIVEAYDELEREVEAKGARLDAMESELATAIAAKDAAEAERLAVLKLFDEDNVTKLCSRPKNQLSIEHEKLRSI